MEIELWGPMTITIGLLTVMYMYLFWNLSCVYRKAKSPFLPHISLIIHGDLN